MSPWETEDPKKIFLKGPWEDARGERIIRNTWQGPSYSGSFRHHESYFSILEELKMKKSSVWNLELIPVIPRALSLSTVY